MDLSLRMNTEVSTDGTLCPCSVAKPWNPPEYGDRLSISIQFAFPAHRLAVEAAAQAGFEVGDERRGAGRPPGVGIGAQGSHHPMRGTAVDNPPDATTHHRAISANTPHPMYSRV